MPETTTLAHPDGIPLGYLSSKETQQRLGTRSRMSLYAMRNDGRLTAYTFGASRKLYFLAEQVNDLLDPKALAPDERIRSKPQPETSKRGSVAKRRTRSARGKRMQSAIKLRASKILAQNWYLTR